MVKLNRIYTRTGDDGTTALGDGTRVHKVHPRIAAYGTVDELAAFVGLAVVAAADDERFAVLRRVQNDLFDLGADLAVPMPAPDADPGRPRIRVGASRVARLEAAIDAANDGLPELTSFVLPGGTELDARLHVARTVCRRAERAVLELADAEPINAACPHYLNRLADLLFVLARLAAVGREVLWVPTKEEET